MGFHVFFRSLMSQVLPTLRSDLLNPDLIPYNLVWLDLAMFL